MMDFTDVAWRKSSHSHTGADCVEVGAWHESSRSHNETGRVEIAEDIQMIVVQDSKNPEGAKLVFSRRDWDTFAERVKGLQA